MSDKRNKGLPVSSRHGRIDLGYNHSCRFQRFFGVIHRDTQAAKSIFVGGRYADHGHIRRKHGLKK